MTKRLYVGTRKGLFTIERQSGVSGPRWSIAASAFLGENCSMVLPDARDGCVYAALEHGHFGVKLHRSRDGGAEWQECAVPAYPPKPDDVVDNDPFKGTPLPWRVMKIWALEAGHAQTPGVLWCGTIPGGLFRSNDGGASWELVRSLWDHPGRKHWFGGGAEYPGIHSICLHPHDARQLTVGVSCGGVWVSADDGATWNCQADGMWAAYMPPEQKFNPDIQDAHRLVRCPQAPDCYWVQHHNGVFRSIDGSASWQEVKDVPPSVFGFAVAVDPADPQTAWFVPAVKDEHRVPVDGKVVVTRTRNGGQTFDVLRNGLPQEHAYDLVYRHGLDVDSGGEALAFGSTTGSLWVSEDQGDHWDCVSEHLPPIHVVRFVK